LVERADNGGSSYTTVTTLSANYTSCWDYPPTNNYVTYRITALSTHNYDPVYLSTLYIPNPPPQPAPPHKVSRRLAGAGSRSISFTDNSSDETGFALERADNGSSNYVQITTLGADSTSYTDSMATGTNVIYRVKALGDVNSDYAYSNSLHVPTIPAAPSN